MLKLAATKQTNMNGVAEEMVVQTTYRSIKSKDAASSAEATDPQEKASHSGEEKVNFISSDSSSRDSSVACNGVADKAAADGTSNSAVKSGSSLDSCIEVVNPPINASNLTNVVFLNAPATGTEPMKNSKLYVLNGNILKEVNDAEKMKSDKVNYVCVTANNLGNIIKKIHGENAVKNGKPMVSSGSGDTDADKSKLISGVPTFFQLSHQSLKSSNPKIAFTVSPTIVTKASTNNVDMLRSKLLETSTAGQPVSKDAATSRVYGAGDKGSSAASSAAKKEQVLDSPAVARARSELVRCRKALIEAAIHPQLPTYTPPSSYSGPTYTCEECEDTFATSEGLSNHKNRRSVLFTYACPVCKKTLEFYNRCMFLLHVRSHDVAVKACFLTISIIPANKLNFAVLDEELHRSEVEPIPLLETGSGVSSAERSSSVGEESTPPQNFQVVQLFKKRKEPSAVDEKTDVESSAGDRENVCVVDKVDSGACSSMDDAVTIDTDNAPSSTENNASDQSSAATVCATKLKKRRFLSNLLMKPVVKPAANVDRSATYTTTNSTTTTPTSSYSNSVENSESHSTGGNVVATPVHLQGHALALKVAGQNAVGGGITSTLDEIHLTSSDEDEAASSEVDTDNLVMCRECKKEVPNLPNHYRATNRPLKDYPCEQCKFFNPSSCALIAHMRMHTRSAPYICPDCGFYFNTIRSFHIHVKQVCFYDYKTIRFKCPECALLKPSVPLFLDHLKRCHIREVFKCSVCITSSYSVRVVQTHMERVHPEAPANVLEGYRCMLCPNVLVAKQSINVHVKKHVFGLQHLRYVYICKFCKKYASGRMSKFEAHYRSCTERTGTPSSLPECSKTARKSAPPVRKSPDKQVPSVEKDPLSVEDWEADKLKAEFGPKTKWCVMCRTTKLNENSKSLFCNACVSYVNADSSGASSADGGSISGAQKVEGVVGRSKRKLKCKLCKQLLNRDWSTITNHYLEDHHADFDVSLTKSSRSQDGATSGSNVTASRKRRSSALKQEPTASTPTTSVTTAVSGSGGSSTASATPASASSTPPVANLTPSKVPKVECKYRCVKCGFSTNVRNDFHEHIVSHKAQSNTNYQCLECGECFIVKPSLEKHLIVVHKVRDISEYYKENKIGGGSDDDADDESKDKAVAENQCEVCYMECDSKQQYDRHIRTHGMAFVAMQSRAKS